jgi:hypothetical protein
MPSAGPSFPYRYVYPRSRSLARRLRSRAALLTSPLVLAACGAAGGTLLGGGGCSSGDGDNSFGPVFGDLPERSRDAGRDGAVIRLPDGAVIPDPGPGPNGCEAGTLAILAGDDGALRGAVQDRGRPWEVTTIEGGAARSKPALVPFGAGFAGVVQGTGDALQHVSYSFGWTNATTFGAAGVRGAPTLAATGSTVHVAYANGSYTFTHGINDGTGWNGATAAIGSPPSFGTISAGLAAADGAIVFAENGTNHGLYVRSYGSSWSEASAVFGVGTVGGDSPATPEIVPGEGAFDLLLVYADNDPVDVVSFAVRRAASKTWENGGNLDALAKTSEKMALTRLAGPRAAVAYRAQDANGYVSLATLADPVTWTLPAPIGGGGAVAVDSTPAVAPGVCGDDLVVAFASGGQIRVVRLRDGAWGEVETIAGLSGSRVAIASR